MKTSFRALANLITAVYEGMPWICGCGTTNPSDATNCSNCSAGWGSTS
ncbi:hypothetical protein ACFVTP_11935 [Streptomyces celluloflavus]